MKMIVELHAMQVGMLGKWRGEQFLFLKNDILEFKSHCEVFMTTKESQIFSEGSWKGINGGRGNDRLGRK